MQSVPEADYLNILAASLAAVCIKRLLGPLYINSSICFCLAELLLGSGLSC